MELLKNAWFGWEKYIQDGKLVALLLAVLLFGWLYKKGTEHKGLLLYTTVMAVGCVFPLTAALLMIYQTRFFDYQWIWSAVPLTAVVAYGITLFLTELWKGTGREQKRTALAVTLLVAVALLLCGSLGLSPEDKALGETADEERRVAYTVIEQLGALAEAEERQGTIVLWAPAEIIEYAREADGRIKLLYGRNMWDVALNAYAYDVYGDNVVELYTVMEEMSHPTGQKMAKTPAEYAEIAVGEGVNCIVLPDSVAWAKILYMAEVLGATPREVEDYWILYGRAD